MARTVSDLATRVLKHLFVIEGGETAEAEDAASVVLAFNAMVDGWFASGLTPVDDETLAAASQTALVEGTAYTLASTFPIKERHFEGVAAMLAVVLQDDFAVDLKPSTQTMAMEGRQRINAAFMPSMVATVDRALRRLPDTILWPST